MNSADWKSKLMNGEPVTVVAYGDSWTYGSVADGWYEAREAGLDAELIHGSWVLQLRKHLQSINPNAVVHNRGKGGWTSIQGLDAFGERVAELRPDVLLLNFGINDWKRPIPLGEYRASMERILDETKAIGSACLLWTSGPLSTISGQTYGWKNPVADEAFPATFDQYSDTIRELTVSRNLPLADAEREIEAEWRSGTDISGWFFDAIHFTQQGHDRIFNCIRRTIESVGQG
ncbi:SGNH/GDSL hydrolase family protein [Paenibacillus hemerocallicola]|uniref:SGNH/GDSL hydrolase family protein n=1 Tax=Paenibacillus hemerocallicola TaxID=1172614 RepID=A0A5C4SYP6_9BACL|nr:SGNH/GDSL hydrolase family protein [Paenibacillus hemerocallicola]TNJ61881.1 SGNH/GDSL hydrolase family protein [Paenibacillus hemerocallicola]